MPIPECVGKPDGTFCKLADGTAGQCQNHTDERRPNRTYQSCTKDNQECDRLALGAECHGYLGKPAHCREFSDSEKKKTWRTCQVDADSAPAAAAAPAAAVAAAVAPAAVAAAVPAAGGIPAAAVAPPTSANAPAPAAETPPAQKGMFSCRAVPGGAGRTPSTPAALSLMGLSLLLLAARRRLSRTD